MSAELMELSDQNFETSVLQNSMPVVVDFWAPWCGPCKQISPIIEELAFEYSGRILFAKMDIAKHTGTVAKYGIKSIPALMFVKDGKVLDIVMGAQPKKKIEARLEKIL